ncbi:MAG: hypothetical protein O7A03_12765, partial [Alphaproteobacteria bacterium]|nr:hypothetical protein [Alphaproteobacteria bacterium]
MSRFLGFAAAFFILIGCTGTVDQPIGEAVRPITHNSQFELALSAGIGTIRHAPVAAVAPGVDHATAQGLVHDCQSLDAELADPGDIGAASDLALAGAHCLGFIRGLTQANARSQTIA